MKNIPSILLILVFLLINSCSKQNRTPLIDEYKIYSSLLEDFANDHSKYNSDALALFVIADSTSNKPGITEKGIEITSEGGGKIMLKNDLDFHLKYGLLKSALKNVWELESLQKDFNTKNEHQTSIIAGRMYSKYPIKTFSRSRFKHIFKNATFEGWKYFYNLFPQSAGFTVFSRVGFNKDKNQAIVYVDNMCGDTAGSGTYYLLKKVNADWVIKDRYESWTS